MSIYGQTDLSRRRSATSLTVSAGTTFNEWQASSHIATTTCLRTFSL